ncbi:hypothetical protein PHISCL_10900 [Aspergillus sclerotialis]|uniref:Uncharacterized protein n=1 Tax=Aspergillus sclerotialis TaxID=2070753 RepID=A0A3A2Z3I6_9EURO|nr:hypothetical protein PHISCL_10900 [Aspergillus sclerotialis]
MVLLADHVPVSKPVSPPKNRPAIPKKVYVMTSPNGVGWSKGVMSGIASSRPLANRTCVGFSAARKA